MTKIIFFADNDTTSDAKAVNTAIIKEQNVDQYCFVGDGPYSKTGTTWVSMMKQSFDDKKDKMIWSRGNHDEDESESKQTQKDMEAWFPQAKGVGISDCWLSSKIVGNVYIISMDSQDMDVEFKRDQYNFVQAELTKAKQLRAAGTIDWIAVLFHKPAFTLKSSHSPYTAVRFLYKDLFRDAQVDFWVHGHNHNTQLWLPMVPDQSTANGEGKQLFTKLPDGTFDFSKDHGWIGIVTGHAGHEWNAINDSGSGVVNVLYKRDSGKFGYTVIETNGKKAKILAKDTDNATVFEYPPITREGTTPPGCLPSECKDPVTGQCRVIAADEIVDANGFCKKKDVPPDCSDPTKCKDPVTGECRLIGPNEHKSSTDGTCQKNIPDPDCPPGQHKDQNGNCVPDTPPPTGVICPRDYHYEESLKRCIPDLEPDLPPQCPAGTKWNGKICVPDSTSPPCLQGECKDPVTGQCRLPGINEKIGANGFCETISTGCPDGQCKDPITQQCRVIGADEIKDSFGMCKPKPVITCPDGQCKDVTTGLCRAIGANEEKDVNGFCKTKDTQPGGKVLYDSNTMGKWNNGQKRTVTEGDGNTDPDGKGLHTAASGNPELTIDGDGISHLESSRWGRIYIYAKNYNSKLKGQFMFETDHGKADNISIKMRSRHGNNNHPQGGSNQFGGCGFAFHPDGEVELAAEITHGGSSFDFGTLNAPAFKLGQWHDFAISVFDKDGITVSVEVDGQNIGSKKWSNPHDTAVDKAAFAADSYFWIRLNCHDGDRAKAGFKNLVLTELD